MSLPGLLIGLILVGLVLLFVLTPLLRRGVSTLDDRQRDRLLMSYERILTNIRDLDEDYSTGKMLHADYETERESWVQRGIQVLKALDSMVTSSDIDPDLDRRIEAAVAAYRAKANLS
jgi:hypothetical protein